MAGRVRTDAQGPEGRVIRVLATAGHVDHGKSTLVEALTGTHPDRLKEEREREMSIDLGFAYLTLPGGMEVGIVDVPGHRDFIANMLAGVGGVDAVLLVVAADEGVMPQTREHVDILDLLGVSTGLVALTKIDLVDDAEWLDLVEEEIRALLQPTSLAQVPIVRVSARTGQGLDALRRALAVQLARAPERPDLGRPRLPIDRAFTLVGFGTVVTGTLMDGSFSLGDEVEILPRGLRARIRGIQTHRQPREQARPGTRTALNLSGVGKDELERGNVVVRPGTYRPTRRVDVQLRVLSHSPVALRHNQWLKFHVWTSEVMARLRLLGAEDLAPGTTGWAQLELREPIVVTYGDRFILRRPSPEATVAGGVVLDAHPRARHRRWDEKVLARMAALSRGDAAALLQGYLEEQGYVHPQRLHTLALPPQAVHAALVQGETRGWARRIETGSGVYWVYSPAWTRWRAKARDLVQDHHRRYPMRWGMPLAELQARMELPRPLFERWLQEEVREGHLVLHGERVALPGHRPHFPPGVQPQVEALLARFREGDRPPTLRECIEAVGEEAYQALVELGYLVPLNDKYVLDRDTYASWLTRVRSFFQEHGPLTVAQVRDLLGSSRRLVVAFLEHLDALGYTRREGGVRHWTKP